MNKRDREWCKKNIQSLLTSKNLAYHEKQMLKEIIVFLDREAIIRQSHAWRRHLKKVGFIKK